MTQKKATNEVINRIAEDIQEIIAVTKSKKLKLYAKSILPNCKT